MGLWGFYFSANYYISHFLLLFVLSRGFPQNDNQLCLLSTSLTGQFIFLRKLFEMDLFLKTSPSIPCKMALIIIRPF